MFAVDSLIVWFPQNSMKSVLKLEHHYIIILVAYSYIVLPEATYHHCIMANQGISVHVKITIDPKDKETFLAALKPTFEAVKAEPLNTFFELSYDEKNPGVFELVESWNCTADYIMKVSISVIVDCIVMDLMMYELADQW